MGSESWLHRVVYMRTAAECTDMAHLFGVVIEESSGVCKVASLTYPVVYTVMSRAGLELADVTGACCEYASYNGTVKVQWNVP